MSAPLFCGSGKFGFAEGRKEGSTFQVAKKPFEICDAFFREGGRVVWLLLRGHLGCGGHLLPSPENNSGRLTLKGASERECQTLQRCCSCCCCRCCCLCVSAAVSSKSHLVQFLLRRHEVKAVVCRCDHCRSLFSRGLMGPEGDERERGSAKNQLLPPHPNCH